MNADVLKVIPSSYEVTEVTKDSALDDITIMIANLKSTWQTKFNDASEKIAKEFTNQINNMTKAQLLRKLKSAGFSVKFKMSQNIERHLAVIISENVSLIRSIPTEYLNRVEKTVRESTIKGRDLAGLKQSLMKDYTATENRAGLIARDQINKATESLAIERSKSVGATQGRWIHVPGVKSSRITHIAMDGQVFDLEQGLYDEDVGKYVLPGELIYCNCTFAPLIPGFE